MSEAGFHVHGPHDHAVEHEAQHDDAFAGRIAVMTAIFATIAAGKASEKQSEASMHVHHRWAQSMTLIQIAIALAAITILTRNKGLMYVAYSAAGIAITIGVFAGLHL